MTAQEWIKETRETLIVWLTMADHEIITHNPKTPEAEKDLLILIGQTENLILGSPEEK